MAVLPPDPVYNLRCSDMGPVNSLCFHQDERILAGTAKGSIYLWDLQTNRSLLHFDVGDSVSSLHHLDDQLISQEKGGKIKCWSMTNTGYVLEHVIENDHPAFCRTDIISTSDKDLLVFPKGENKACILSTDNFEVLQTLEPDDSQSPPMGHISAVKAITVGEQQYVVVGYESGFVLTWDLRNCQIINREKFNEIPIAIDYDPVTNRGLCAGPGDQISVFSYQRQTMGITKKTPITIKNPGINCLRIRPDQKVFTSGGWDGRIRIFSWKSLRPLAVLTEHKTGGVMDIAYSKGKVSMWKAHIMAAGGADGQITLWDLYN